MCFVNFSIPDDLLIDVLSHVPVLELFKTCRLVCKDWKNIVDGHSVWKLKCEREKCHIPSIPLQNIPYRYYEKIYILDPYDKNLVQNPCGEEGLVGWIMTVNKGDGLALENFPAGADPVPRKGFAVENPPVEAYPVPQQVGSHSCFATTYYPCMKYQLIDLFANGISREVLKAKTTKIEIGEWVAAQFGCTSEYHLYVALLNENFCKYAEELEEYIIDDFKHEFREEQWIGRQWHSVTHTFENVGRVRYVYFRHDGKDNHFWGGHFGCKMTGAFVKVVA